MFVSNFFARCKQRCLGVNPKIEHKDQPPPPNPLLHPRSDHPRSHVHVGQVCKIKGGWAILIISSGWAVEGGRGGGGWLGI